MPPIDSIYSDQFWTDTFMVVSYAMALGCVYRGIRRGARGHHEGKSITKAVLLELTVFTTFVVLLWGLESLAKYAVPYYIYSPKFRDLVPELGLVRRLPPPPATTCTSYVAEIQHTYNAAGIPLCVVLFEASLTHAAMYAARTAHASLRAQPFLAGLYLANLDILLDPVVATSHDCPGSGHALRLIGNGLGLWHWFVPSPGQQGDGTQLLASWFAVPLFNYIAWLAAPITLVALVNLLGPFRRHCLQRDVTGASDEDAPHRITRSSGFFLVLLFLMPATVVWGAPKSNPPPGCQWLIVTLLLGACVVFFFYGSFGRFRWKRFPDVTLTWPSTVALFMPVTAGVFVGRFAQQPMLIVVAVVIVVLGLWLAWLPYLPSLEKFVKHVGFVGRFVRLHYFGFSAVMILAGALTKRNPGTAFILGLLIIAAAFHVFSYVLNDVIDLELDKTQPLRIGDPLVTGGISKETAIGVALSGVPLAFLLVLHVTHFRAYGAYAFYVLAAGMLLMTVYNVWGKRFRVPVITDGVQGIAWGSLAVVGGIVSDEAEWRSNMQHFTLPVFAYGAFFLLLINGIHGGLRDLINDEAHDRWSTARLLGAIAVDPRDPSKGVKSNWKIMLFAFVVHALIFASLGSFVLFNQATFGNWKWTISALAAVLSFSLYVLFRVVRPLDPRRNDFIGYHLSWLLFAGVIVFVSAGALPLAIRIVLVLTALGPLVLREDILLTILEVAYRRSPPRRPQARPVSRSSHSNTYEAL